MKTSAPRIALAVILAWLVAPCAPAAESLSVLLQKAIYAEETEGNLESAIRIYEQISADGAANRSIIAQAQFRLAVCFQKLGRNEQAVSLLREISRQFPTENGLGQKAREQLAALGQFVANAVTLRKVAVVNTEWLRGISPDERVVLYTGSEGEIFIHDTVTGTTREMGNYTWYAAPWYDFIFSPDGNRMTYDLEDVGLLTANLDGSGVRRVYAPENKDYVWPAAWPRTGEIIAGITDHKTRARSLVAIDPQSGSLVRRYGFPLQPGSSLAVSLDGRYIAVRNNSQLSVVDLQTGREETVVEDHAGSILGWIHGDTEIYFRSDRSGKTAVWSVKVAAGKPASAPSLVREFPENTYLVQTAADGRIYYIENINTANIFIATVDFESGAIDGEPRLVTDRFPGLQTTPAWSSDGKKLWLAIDGEKRRFVSVQTVTGREEDFPTINEFEQIRGGFSLSSDGSFALLRGVRLRKQGGPVSGIHRFDFATSKVDTLEPGTQLNRPRITPDGKSFVYSRRQRIPETEGRTRKSSVIRRDLSSGEETVLHMFSGNRVLSWGQVEVSPDGARIAIVTEDMTRDFVVAIELVELGNRKATELLRLPPRHRVTSLAWTPDGRRLVYSTSAPSKDSVERGRTEIWSTAINSGRSTRLRLTLPAMTDIAVHPDGRQLAFRSGSPGETGQLWVIEGLPPLQASPEQSPLRQKAVARTASIAIRPREMLGPNNVIKDPLHVVSATLPPGWVLRSANRLAGGLNNVWPNAFTGVVFGCPVRLSDARLAYEVYDAPRPIGEEDAKIWLGEWATKIATVRQEFFSKYRQRPQDLVFGRVGERPALSWIADYTARNGTEEVEYGTVIRGEKGHALFYFQGSAEEIEAMRPVMNSLIASLRLP